MRIIVIVLLLLGAHFSLAPFAPAQTGQATFYWPFARDSKPIFNDIGGLATLLFAGVAGLCFLAAALALLGIAIPADWWPVLVVSGAIASSLLYILYFGPYALLPVAIDAALLWGLQIESWTVAGLCGS